MYHGVMEITIEQIEEAINKGYSVYIVINGETYTIKGGN